MTDVLCIVAHPDDEVVGMGGTILKCLEEGKSVATIIFSYGEKSHPHIKEKIIARTRVGETKKLDEMLNRESIFFGLTEGKITEESETLDVTRKLANLIKRHKPKRIFTHTSSDPHRDHRAVNKIVGDALKQAAYKGELLTFEVWNITGESSPAVYVDITPYFRKKLALMRIYESQRHFIYALLVPVITRARLYGRKNNCRYAEKFYKMK